MSSLISDCLHSVGSIFSVLRAQNLNSPKIIRPGQDEWSKGSSSCYLPLTPTDCVCTNRRANRKTRRAQHRGVSVRPRQADSPPFRVGLRTAAFTAGTPSLQEKAETQQDGCDAKTRLNTNKPWSLCKGLNCRTVTLIWVMADVSDGFAAFSAHEHLGMIVWCVKKRCTL